MYRRIVSLAPSFSETISFLEKENLLVGVTEYCNYPEICKTLPKIGGFANPDLEKIISLKPDLVLATTFHKLNLLKKLEDINIKVVQINANKIFYAPNILQKIGSLLGKENLASEKALQMQKEFDQINTLCKTIKTYPKVCFLCTSIPFCSHKPVCQINSLVEHVGGKLCSYREGDIPQQIAESNPDIIIIPYIKESDYYKNQMDFIKNNPIIHKTNAYIEGKIRNIDDNYLSRPGPRAASGLKQLFNLVHN